jgi:hypothetical protein
MVAELDGEFWALVGGRSRGKFGKRINASCGVSILDREF